MFCKASVLKCPGLKKKKGSLTVLLAESYLFLTMKIFKSTLCLPTAGGGKKKNKENGSMLAKTGAKCTKTLIS